jgi:hypothetical protein
MPDGGSDADNWQAVPEHAINADPKIAREEIPVRDKAALICFIADRLRQNDGQYIHLLDVNWTAAKAFAKGQKTTMKIPGLKAINPAVYRKRRG